MVLNRAGFMSHMRNVLFVGFLLLPTIASASSIISTDRSTVIYSGASGPSVAYGALYVPGHLVDGQPFTSITIADVRFDADGTRWNVALFTGCTDTYDVTTCANSYGLSLTSGTELDCLQFTQGTCIGLWTETWTSSTPIVLAGNAIFRFYNPYGFSMYGSSANLFPSGVVFTNQNGQQGATPFLDLEYGGPFPAGALFVSSLSQLTSNQRTLVEGGTINSNTVIFQGIPQSSSTTDPLQLQVEAEPFGVPFSGVPTAASSPVASGQLASVTVALGDGAYHWQARATDSRGDVSGWQRFGPSANATDFVINTTGGTTVFDFENQTGSIGTDNGGGGFNGPLGLSIRLGRPNMSVGPTTPLRVQFFQNGTSGCSDPGYSFQAFTDSTYMTPAGGFGLESASDATGNPISLQDYNGIVNATVSGTFDVNDYYTFGFGSCDFSRPISIRGDASGTYVCTQVGGPFGAYCYQAYYQGGFPYLIVSPLAPQTTASIASGTLKQYKSDAMTTMFDGETTAENTVVFGATLQSSSTDSLQLQIELEPAGMTFTGIPNLRGTTVASGTAVTVATSSLLDGPYHWQARVIDTSKNTASLWQTLSNPADGTDFVVHQVPLVAQIDPRWRNSPYANGRGNNPNDPGRCGPNIGNCGCAITSVAMVLQYHGIINAVDNQPVNPLNLDAWLDNNNGYGEFGDLDWLKIEEYSQTSPNGLARIHYDGGFGGDTGLLDSNVNSRQPAILKVQVPTASGGFAVHYIVAHTKLATTYSIRDPLLFNTKTLNDPADDFANHIRAYGNQFAGLRLYSSFSGPVDGITLTIASPAQLLVTDPTGRRLGINPISNTSYSEITDGTYFTDGISDVSTSNTTPAHEVKTAYIPNPIPGNYQVQVIGTGSGPYSFSSLAYDANGTAHSQIFDGITQTNLVTPYVLNFVPQQPSNIATASQIVFGGFLPPIRTDGLGSYHQGQTIPIKFQLTDASGAFLTNRTAQLFVAKIANNVVGTDSAAISAGAANSGNTFRFDPIGNQYIFNLDTTALDTGTWHVKMILDDGTSHTVVIFIKS